MGAEGAKNLGIGKTVLSNKGGLEMKKKKNGILSESWWKLYQKGDAMTLNVTSLKKKEWPSLK